MGLKIAGKPPAGGRNMRPHRPAVVPSAPHRVEVRHRGAGVARAAVAGTLEAIRANGGGVVEAYPEQVEGRPPQRGAYLHTGPETLFEEFGFVRDRRIAKWRWVMRLDLPA